MMQLSKCLSPLPTYPPTCRANCSFSFRLLTLSPRFLLPLRSSSRLDNKFHHPLRLAQHDHVPRVTALRLRPRHRGDLTLHLQRDHPVQRAEQVHARNLPPGGVVDVDAGNVRRRVPGERHGVQFRRRAREVVEEEWERVAAVHLFAYRVQERDGRVVGIFGHERAGQKDEFPNPAGEAVGFSEGEPEVLDGVGADVAAGGVHDQEELLAFDVDEVVDGSSDGGDVVGVGFGGGAIGAGADEGEDVG